MGGWILSSRTAARRPPRPRPLPRISDDGVEACRCKPSWSMASMTRRRSALHSSSNRGLGYTLGSVLPRRLGRPDWDTSIASLTSRTSNRARIALESWERVRVVPCKLWLHARARFISRAARSLSSGRMSPGASDCSRHSVVRPSGPVKRPAASASPMRRRTCCAFAGSVANTTRTATVSPVGTAAVW